jgi:hypothetical protein
MVITNLRIKLIPKDLNLLIPVFTVEEVGAATLHTEVQLSGAPVPAI